MEANGESGNGKKTGVALNRPNKKKYRKGFPWQRHNGFGHKFRKFCVKYALSCITPLLVHVFPALLYCAFHGVLQDTELTCR